MIFSRYFNGLFLLLLLFSACSSSNEEQSSVKDDKETVALPVELITKTEYGPDSIFKIVYQLDKNTNKKHGKYQEYDIEGNLVIEREFVADQAQGIEKNYYPSGKLEGKVTQERGLYHGPFTYYYEDGTIKQEGAYVDNQMEGVLKTYYPDGTLKDVVTLVGGLTQGPFTEYNPNGTLKAEGAYGFKGELEEMETGVLKEYDKEGILLTKKICKDGQCCTVWTKEKGDVAPSSKFCQTIIESMQSDTINNDEQPM